MSEPAQGPVGAFFSSKGWRFAVLIMLTVLMLIPLGLISLVIEDRVSYRRDAIRDVSTQWGGEIDLQGPVMVLPVEVERTRTVKDVLGEARTETYWDQAEPIILMPEDLDIAITADSIVRRLGIFEVPVFGAEMSIAFGFDTDRASAVMRPRERILWDKSSIAVLLPQTRSFADHAVLSVDGRAFDLEPGTPLTGGQSPARIGGARTVGARELALEPGTPLNGLAGIQAVTGDPRGLGQATLTMRLNGARQITLTPSGRQTDVTMTSDWPHPSFTGNFLPKERTVTDEGFSATWAVPHLARNIPQAARQFTHGNGRFGVRFYNPVDLYQKSQRAVKYGILFVALTFLAVFLTEQISRRRVHAAQFILIGLAQCIFFLLLLSLAEQIGFTLAYLAASGATIGLLGFYSATALGLARRAWVLVGSLVALYGTLFLILRSTDYALLAGSVLSFVAIALVMILTRGENWSGTGRIDASGPADRHRKPPEPAMT